MKACLAALMMALASPALADGWYFKASLAGGTEFSAFTNETGAAARAASVAMKSGSAAPMK